VESGAAPPRRELFLPRRRRISWVAIAVSLGVHASLFLFRVPNWSPNLPSREQIALIPMGTEGPRAIQMIYLEPSGGGTPPRTPTSGISALPREETGPPPETEPTEPALEPAPAAPEREGPQLPPGPVQRQGQIRIAPAAGDGNLWVRPLPLPPQDLARAVVRSHAELVDSAVTAIVQAYIDSVLSVAPANEPLPRWTTQVGQQQLGLDAQWIYLGPIKVPTTLVAGLLNALGALPSGASAEMSDYTRFRSLQQMREDVQRAARRAQTMEDFKRAIQQLRVERERQREFARNQRTPPSPPADTSGRTP